MESSAQYFAPNTTRCDFDYAKTTRPTTTTTCRIPIERRSLPRINYSNRKTRFVVFLKRLLDMLRDSGEMVLLEQCRLAVLHCTHRNRMGDMAYSPLVECTERRLLQIVGKLRWELAQTETNIYFAKRESAVLRLQKRRRCGSSSPSTNNWTFVNGTITLRP